MRGVSVTGRAVGLAALLGVVWAVLAWAPASWLADAVGAATHGQVMLADARGSWRDGSARVVLTGGGDSRAAAVAPGRLAWQVDCAGLWRGAVGLRLDWGAIAPQPLRLQAQAGIGRWALRQSAATSAWDAHVPAALLEGLGTPWNTLALQGRIDLELRRLALESSGGRMRLAGSVRADFADMSSRLSTISPLGSYTLQVHGDGPGAALELETVSGALRLHGKGGWNGTQLQFSGRADAAPDQQQALAGLLGLLGQRDGDGVRIAL